MSQEWERLWYSGGAIKRLPIPGGWLVKAAGCPDMTFVPDPNHGWKPEWELKQKLEKVSKQNLASDQSR